MQTPPADSPQGSDPRAGDPPRASSATPDASPPETPTGSRPGTAGSGASAGPPPARGDEYADAHEHRIRVRYGETDQMGRLHHANHVLYLEEARTRMMADRGCSYAAMEERGLGLPVRSLDLRYRDAVRFDEEVRVLTRVARVRGASLTFAYRMERVADGARVADATVELACVDLRRDPPTVVPLPDSLRAVLKA